MAFCELLATSQGLSFWAWFVQKVSQTDATVLLTGETGTGKDLLARAVHYSGPRKEKKFVAQNCGALPDTLLESELFGHERGAFTGAQARRIGRFEQADGGSLVLDELQEWPEEVQLLFEQYLDSGEFPAMVNPQRLAPNVRLLATASAVASAHPIATEAGLEIMADGGNAFSADVGVTTTGKSFGNLALPALKPDGPRHLSAAWLCASITHPRSAIP